MYSSKCSKLQYKIKQSDNCKRNRKCLQYINNSYVSGLIFHIGVLCVCKNEETSGHQADDCEKKKVNRKLKTPMTL